MASSLPEGFRVRSATVEDAPAINELVIAVDTAVQGWSDSTEAELVDWWRLTELAGNSWVVEDDTLAAYAVLIVAAAFEGGLFRSSNTSRSVPASYFFRNHIEIRAADA